ncbi:hypothetical protein PCASD_04524 [Puccinia coronata f. sp. avenae]|uniref:BED-type domain-containing protein n=1 Tax=Puccinia coronata f. sp. avenae TaxID=200324 RepID=A0A2N5V2Y1_9BASI|nr:hypothetical protein PCASD_04524 [Puccinia coronata f. sp. avenae]
MANCSPGSNTNDIQVIQPPGQELSQSHGATPTTGTTTSNQTEIESSASQTPAPAESVSESQEESQPKKRKLTSEVWEHFTKIKDKQGKPKAQCNYCPDILSAASTGGTNHLQSHSKACLAKNGDVSPQRQALLGFTSSAQTSSNRVWVFSQEKTRKKLARMIILHKYPFSMAEHEGFIKFMQTAQPNFAMPGRKAVRSDCVNLYQTMKKIEIANMAKASQIALTTELWSASDLTGYMVVTAHYINQKWQLTKRIIGFRPLPPPHTGQAIADCLSQTLLDWKAVNKVAFVTLDNASSNNLAMTRLQRFLDDRSHPGETTTSPYFHV